MTPTALARVAKVVEAAGSVEGTAYTSYIGGHEHGEVSMERVAVLRAFLAAYSQPVTPAEVEEVAKFLAHAAWSEYFYKGVEHPKWPGDMDEEALMMWRAEARAMLTALGLTVSPEGAGR